MFKHLSLLLCLFLSVACSYQSQTEKAREFEVLLENETGEVYTVVKGVTKVGGYSVFRNERTGEFVAYNISIWDQETMLDLGSYLAVAVEGTDYVSSLEKTSEWVESGYWSDITSYQWVEDEYYDYDCSCWIDEGGYENVVIGEEWIDTSGYRDFYYGGGFRFNNTTTNSRDLELLAALDEDAAKDYISTTLKSSLSLSSERAGELASLVSRYKKLENHRSLTAKEQDYFAMEALGVKYSEVESALKKKTAGEEDDYKRMLEKAAQTNRTSPEQIGSFINNLL